jgi:DNA modification methylase
MVRLIHGDCLIEMQSIPDKSVDLILSDPPYGSTACKWDVVIPFDKLWEQYKRIIKDKGAIVLFGSEPFSSHLRISNLKWYKYDWVWQKNRNSNFMTTKYRPRNMHEDILVFYEVFGTYNPQLIEFKEDTLRESKWSKKDFKTPEDGVFGSVNVSPKKPEREGALPIDILEFKKENNNQFKKSVFHPTQKPVALLEYLIKTYTNEGDLVLDNCMGSGSTMVACKNLNRDGIGIEKEEKYFKIAEERINDKIEEAA